MSEYFVIKKDPCERCGGTGSLYYLWDAYQENVRLGMDPVRAVRESYGNAGLAYAVEVNDISPEALREALRSRCPDCNESGVRQSHVPLREALDAIGR
jgi:hypothetical protein